MIENFSQLKELAYSCSRSRLAVAAAAEKEVLKAVYSAYQEGLIDPVLIGTKNKIIKYAAEVGFEANNFELIDTANKQKACEKAVKLVAKGDCHILMKGIVDTSQIMKEVLSEDYGLTSNRLISHIAMIESTILNRIIFVTDGGMNIKPDLGKKKQIIENAVKVAHLLGYDMPKVAVLAAVEKVNQHMRETTEAAALAKMSERGQIEGAVVDGPLALDNALSEEAAQIKGIKSDVAGKADILLVPEIVSGNLLGKSPVYLAGDNIATIIGGTTQPVVLTSRANTAKIKLISIAAAVVMADKKGIVNN